MRAYLNRLGRDFMIICFVKSNQFTPPAVRRDTLQSVLIPVAQMSRVAVKLEGGTVFHAATFVRSAEPVKLEGGNVFHAATFVRSAEHGTYGTAHSYWAAKLHGSTPGTSADGGAAALTFLQVKVKKETEIREEKVTSDQSTMIQKLRYERKTANRLGRERNAALTIRHHWFVFRVRKYKGLAEEARLHKYSKHDARHYEVVLEQARRGVVTGIPIRISVAQAEKDRKAIVQQDLAAMSNEAEMNAMLLCEKQRTEKEAKSEISMANRMAQTQRIKRARNDFMKSESQNNLARFLRMTALEQTADRKRKEDRDAESARKQKEDQDAESVRKQKEDQDAARKQKEDRDAESARKRKQKEDRDAESARKQKEVQDAESARKRKQKEDRDAESARNQRVCRDMEAVRRLQAASVVQAAQNKAENASNTRYEHYMCALQGEKKRTVEDDAAFDRMATEKVAKNRLERDRQANALRIIKDETASRKRKQAQVLQEGVVANCKKDSILQEGVAAKRKQDPILQKGVVAKRKQDPILQEGVASPSCSPRSGGHHVKDKKRRRLGEMDKQLRYHQWEYEATQELKCDGMGMHNIENCPGPRQSDQTRYLNVGDGYIQTDRSSYESKKRVAKSLGKLNKGEGFIPMKRS
jgi:hypothetical protein